MTAMRVSPTTSDSPLAVVLVHGILGFERIRFLRKEVRYFRKLWKNIHVPGVALYFPALPPVGGIRTRARILSDYLARIPAGPIALIGHSMGGLDSRYAIHRHDPNRRIRFLATVATPHRGTPLARWMVRGRGLLPWMGRRLMLPGLAALTPNQCRRFNDRVPDRPDVVYHSYAGVRPDREMAPWFRPWCRMIQERDGDNDSQVSLSSATWGRFCGAMRADHLELAGWSLALPQRSDQRPFDHVSFYRHIITSAAEMLAGGNAR